MKSLSIHDSGVELQVRSRVRVPLYPALVGGVFVRFRARYGGGYTSGHASAASAACAAIDRRQRDVRRRSACSCSSSSDTWGAISDRASHRFPSRSALSTSPAPGTRPCDARLFIGTAFFRLGWGPSACAPFRPCGYRDTEPRPGLQIDI